MSDDALLDVSVVDDAQLIGRTLSGEPAAFGELVLRYQDRLYNSLVRLVGSAEDARDVAQDAFVTAFVKLDTFRGSSAFYTWLYRIAFNLAMSHTRRRRPTRSLEEAKAEFGREPVDDQPTPEANLACRERATLVRDALAKLGAEHRQVIVLREIEGCKYEEIAEILELPIGTVRSRLFRARLELRDRLASVFSEYSSPIVENKM